MSTPSSWQQWATDRQRKDLFVVSISHSTTPKPSQLSTSPARSTGKSQLYAETIPPQRLPPLTASSTKTSNQLKTETSTLHHPLTTASLPRSTLAPKTPPKKRPETTDVVARRLIGRALGITFAKREGEGERFGINTKTKTQTKSAAELELVRKMEEVRLVRRVRESGR
jgi:hypothetical protein